MINKICLKGPSCDVDICLETSSSFVADVKSIKHPEHRFNWERFSSFTRYERLVHFLLRMLPSHKHFRGKDLGITDLSETHIAKSKLIHLAQMKPFPVELKSLNKGKPIENGSKIAKYSPFIGPAGIIRSTRRIVRLVITEFDIKHPILLDTRHTLVRLLARILHHKRFHQVLDYMRSVLYMKYAILGLRRLLRSNKNQCDHAVKAKQVQSSLLCPIYLSSVSDISNHPLIIWVLITLDRFTFRFAEALKKDRDFFSLASAPGLYTMRLYHLWTLVLVSWALNGSLPVVVHQARSGMITARTSLVSKKKLLACINSWNGMAPTIVAHKCVA